MKETLLIHFVDFWDKFNPESNFLINALSCNYKIELNEKNPQVVFFSHFGKQHLNYTERLLIFFSGEPIALDPLCFDYCISWRNLKSKNHYRLPLYKMYFQDVGSWLPKFAKFRSQESIRHDWLQKKGLCCMVVSNPNCRQRNEAFRQLSKYIQVDSGGRFLNNIGGPVTNKLDFIKNYKFVLSFENSKHAGYTTEKVFEPILENCIPIYWGNSEIGKDVNEKRILNFENFDGIESLAERIINISKNPSEAMKILQQNILPKNLRTYNLKEEYAFIDFLKNSINKGISESNSKRKLLRILRSPDKYLSQKIKFLKIRSSIFLKNALKKK